VSKKSTPSLGNHEVAATPASPRAALRWNWLGAAALLAQVWAVYFLSTEGASGLTRRVVLPLTIALLLVFALRNWHLWGVRLMALGFLLNLLAVSSNGGFMPVSPEDVAEVNMLDRIENVQLGEPIPGSKGILMAPRDARLWFLSDIIVFPPRGPVAKVVSVGDLLVLGGLVIACAEVIGRNSGWRSARQP
jgi:hypothetical protein